MTRERDAPNNDDSGAKSAGKARTTLTWMLLAVVSAMALTVGACALWMPDRAPALLGEGKEATSAPVNTQEYAGGQQVTVIPTVSAARDLIGNASGTVTSDWSASGLVSGKAALKVNDRVVVALATETPLYRNLGIGDTGDDVLALNNELSRLGYDSVPGSNTYWWATSNGFRQLMADNGNPSNGSLKLADVLWIPDQSVRVGLWSAVEGTAVQSGAAIGQVAGSLTQLAIKNGQPVEQDRTLTVLGQTTTLAAGQTVITDAAFCNQVAATEDYRSMDAATLAAGINASLTLSEPMQVLRVPAGAVFGVNGTQGCIAVLNGTGKGAGAESAGDFTVTKISIVGSELGVSLVQPESMDASSITNVAIGSQIAQEQCR